MGRPSTDNQELLDHKPIKEPINIWCYQNDAYNKHSISKTKELEDKEALVLLITFKPFTRTTVLQLHATCILFIQFWRCVGDAWAMRGRCVAIKCIVPIGGLGPKLNSAGPERFISCSNGCAFSKRTVFLQNISGSKSTHTM